MEQNGLWHRVAGYVRFGAEGGLPGRLLSLAAREGITVWGSRRQEAAFDACCLARDYRRLRPLARRCGLPLRVKERHGPVFFLRRYHARPGLVAGIAAYILLLAFLSGRIWAIDLCPTAPENAAELRQFLTAQGVAVGGRCGAIDPTAIKLAALQQLPDISWLAVNTDGCIAEVEWRPVGTDEAPKDPDAPSNLIAARDGLILSTEITEGEATVHPGDAVAQGGLLASGITATAGETLLRRSAGIVMAETTREVVITVPLQESIALPTDGGFETLELRLFGLLLPLSPRDAPAADCRLEECDRLWRLGGVDLPVGLRMRRYTPLTAQTATRTAGEAEALAMQRLAAEEGAALLGAQVIGRTLTTEVGENVLTLRVVYRCVENIAEEVPLHLQSADAAG